MRLLTQFFLFVLVVALIGCNVDSVVDHSPSDELSGSAIEVEQVTSAFASKSHPVPTKDRAWGEGFIAGFPGDCSVGGVPGLPVALSGEGLMTHVGRYTFVQTGHCLDLVSGDYEGTVQITAANGDELWATYSGQSGPGEGAFSSNGSFVGGTGRFQDASGLYIQTGVSTDPSTGSFTFQLTTHGSILY